MKTLSANLKAHLQGDYLTVCTLWKVTRADATVYGFTDNSRDVVYDGVTYAAATGHTPSSISTNAGMNVDNLEVEALLDAGSITVADLEAGLWDFAQVEILIVNYLSLGDGHMMLRKGWLGNVKNGRSGFTAELRGMMQPLQQVIGRLYTPNCDATLGDARCAKSLVAFTVTGTVDSAASARVFTDAARVEADGYFDGGLITWTGGANSGYSMEVKTSTALGVITLQQPMANAIAMGDTYSLVAGCDKTLAKCRDTFNNVVNFRGFPHVPGIDRMVSGT